MTFRTLSLSLIQPNKFYLAFDVAEFFLPWFVFVFVVWFVRTLLRKKKLKKNRNKKKEDSDTVLRKWYSCVCKRILSFLDFHFESIVFPEGFLHPSKKNEKLFVHTRAISSSLFCTIIFVNNKKKKNRYPTSLSFWFHFPLFLFVFPHKTKKTIYFVVPYFIFLTYNNTSNRSKLYSLYIFYHPFLDFIFDYTSNFLWYIQLLLFKTNLYFSWNPIKLEYLYIYYV